MEKLKVLTRRDCVVAASALMVIGRQAFSQSAPPPAISVTRDPAHPWLPTSLRVAASNYVWFWSAATDLFRLEDLAGREIASAQLQPSLAMRVGNETRDRPGQLNAVQTNGDRALFVYVRADLQASITVEIGFAHDRLWYEPVRIQGRASADVVELRWFSALEKGQMRPRLSNNVLVVPGVDMSPAVGPILAGDVYLDSTVWLGRGASPWSGFFQQWGLPVHYFCGYNLEGGPNTRDTMRHLSAAFCCGLASLPAADVLLQTANVRHSLIFRYHSELWGQARLPGSLSLGARILFTFGTTVQDAIRAYYQAIRQTGEIRFASPSPAKRAIMTSSIYSTWGAQAGAQTDGLKLTQAELEDIYGAFRATGLRMDVFEIDEDWESDWGTLSHPEDRLPHFEAFLDRVRADGMKIGLWMAPLRCGTPQRIGLKPEHMLRAHGVGPAEGSEPSAPPYFLLDVTQPAVAANVRERLQRMMKRYRPSLVKFDFGYEMPPLSLGAPADMRFAGEKLLIKAMDVLAGAVREIDPDVVIMYYGLSPFLIGRIDIHSPDDLYPALGDYDIEGNRRFFFSSLMGELGMPTYGSGGYDWVSMPSIWFDSVMIGSLGVLADCRGDVRGAKPTRDMVALFNGLRETVRHTTEFAIQTSPVDSLSPTRGAHAPSWIRRERGDVVGVALRHEEWLGSPGTSSVPGIIETDISVVVSSRTDDPLTRTTSVAIVPLGDGEVRLSRTRRRGSAQLLHHYADGSTRSERITVKDGLCALHLKKHGSGGVPLEWCELRFEGASGE